MTAIRLVCYTAAALAIFAGGCVICTKPIFKPDQVGTDESLRGKWVVADEKVPTDLEDALQGTQIDFQAPGPDKVAKATLTGNLFKNNPDGQLIVAVRVGKIGEFRVAEFRIDNPDQPGKPMYFPAIYQRVDAKHITGKLLDPKWFSNYIASHPDELAVQPQPPGSMGGGGTITDSADAVQKFLLRHAREQSAFDTVHWVRPDALVHPVRAPNGKFDDAILGIRFFSDTSAAAVTSRGILLTDGSLDRWKGVAPWDRQYDGESLLGGTENVLWLRTAESHETTIKASRELPKGMEHDPELSVRIKGDKSFVIRTTVSYTLWRWTRGGSLKPIRRLAVSADDPREPPPCAFASDRVGAFAEGGKLMVTADGGASWVENHPFSGNGNNNGGNITQIEPVDDHTVAIVLSSRRIGLAAIDAAGHATTRWEINAPESTRSGGVQLVNDPGRHAIWAFAADTIDAEGVLSEIGASDGKVIRQFAPFDSARHESLQGFSVRPLATYPPPPPPPLPALSEPDRAMLHLLETGSWRQRTAAEAMLESRGDAAAPTVQAMLRITNSPEVRTRLQAVLAGMGHPDWPAGDRMYVWGDLEGRGRVLRVFSTAAKDPTLLAEIAVEANHSDLDAAYGLPDSDTTWLVINNWQLVKWTGQQLLTGNSDRWIGPAVDNRLLDEVEDHWPPGKNPSRRESAELQSAMQNLPPPLMGQLLQESAQKQDQFDNYRNFVIWETRRARALKAGAATQPTTAAGG